MRPHTRAESRDLEWIRALATEVTLSIRISEIEGDRTTKDDAEAGILARDMTTVQPKGVILYPPCSLE